MSSPNKFLRRRSVLAKVGISNTLLFNLEKAGKFPQHILLTPRCAVWLEADVDEWMRQRLDGQTNSRGRGTTPNSAVPNPEIACPNKVVQG
jgi:predicted DNA-binding transcriptional regulator AlpA